jgi:hypothetical protein
MRASHVPATDSKRLSNLADLLFYIPTFHLNRLRSHTRQMQAGAPGAVGQQRATGGRRDNNELW